MKKRLSGIPIRSAGLLTLGCVLLSLWFPDQSTKAALPGMPTIQTASPTPSPIQKRSKPARRRSIRKRTRPPISDPPTIFLKASQTAIAVCPVVKYSIHDCPKDSEVELSATVGSPKLDAGLLFTWSVAAGRVRGEGNKVIWDLRGLVDGTYTASVEVNDGNQLTAVAQTQVTVTQCPDCVFSESPCPIISVSCPAAVDLKEQIVFEATVSGGEYGLKLIYTWSVTGGKIISGQGTSKITVKASKTGQTVTAALTVGGTDPLCKDIGVNTASCRVDEVRRP